jgi:HlyD family secretion protein
MKKSRKWSLFVGDVAVVAVGAWGLSLNGASSTIDPAKVATVERGTTTRPAVATGKIEPITKVEIKSKANGILENLFVDVDHLVTPGQVLAELDKGILPHASATPAPISRRRKRRAPARSRS